MLKAFLAKSILLYYILKYMKFSPESNFYDEEHKQVVAHLNVGCRIKGSRKGFYTLSEVAKIVTSVPMRRSGS